MSDQLKDILSNLNPEIDQETLLRYLQGKLSAQEQHELEKEMMDDFGADALEGLEQFGDKKNIASVVNQLNKDLKKRTSRGKKLREKLKTRLEPWILLAIVLILLIAVLGFLLVRHKLH